MRSPNEQSNVESRSDYRELQLLSEFEKSPEVTQRELSRKVGIALGLTNLLVRKLVQKGYIRATGTTWKRWLYTLTPAGLSHKVNLTVGYVNRVLSDYHTARSILIDELEALTLHRESRVAICGTGEFAELVYLALQSIGVEEITVFDSNGSGDRKFLGMPVHHAKDIRTRDYDRILIASLGNEQIRLEALDRYGLTADNAVTFFAGGVISGVK